MEEADDNAAARGSDVGASGAPAVPRDGEGADGAQLGVGKREVQTASSGASGNGEERRPEVERTPARCGRGR